MYTNWCIGITKSVVGFTNVNVFISNDGVADTWSNIDFTNNKVSFANGNLVYSNANDGFANDSAGYSISVVVDINRSDDAICIGIDLANSVSPTFRLRLIQSRGRRKFILKHG